MNICQGCQWEHWMPEKSSEPWCPCDICEIGDQYKPSEGGSAYAPTTLPGMHGEVSGMPWGL